MSNRALVLQSPGLEALAFEDREVPTPGPGEAVVRLRASCLNYHDFVVLKGLQPSVEYPRVPLSDGAGEVVAVGEGVTRVVAGSRVCANFYRDWYSKWQVKFRILVSFYQAKPTPCASCNSLQLV